MSRHYIKTEITRNVLRRVTGEGLLVVDGEEHKRQRKILTPAFAGTRIVHLIPNFWAKGCELSKYWEENAVDVTGVKWYEVFGDLSRTTLDIIGLAGTPSRRFHLFPRGTDTDR
jgi:cytochrome P450